MEQSPKDIAQQLRDQCAVLRYKPIPLEQLIPLLQRAADALDANPTPTPAAEWREKGEPDPHGHTDTYTGGRERLCMGNLSDDALANEFFLHYDVIPRMADVIAGTARMPIVYATAAKVRIRWLSRQLEAYHDPKAKVRLSPGEVRAMATWPLGLTALADWHDWQETQADASDMPEAAKHHRARRLTLHAEAQRINAEWAA